MVIDVDKAHSSGDTAVVLLFSWTVSFTPLLYAYASISPQISIADLLFICFSMIFAMNFFFNRSSWRPNFFALKVFVFYLIISSLISILFSNVLYIDSIVARWSKTILFILVISLFPNYLKQRHFQRGLEVLCLFSSAIITVQYLMFFAFGYTRSLKIPLLNFVTSESVRTFSFANFRPSAFFLEPAHFAYCLSLYLAYCLFSQHSKRRLSFRPIVTTFAILLSTSSTGIVLLVFLWSLYLLKSLAYWRNPRKMLVYLVLLVIVLGVFVPLVLFVPQFFNSISRILDLESVAVTGRIEAGSVYFESQEGVDKWIGVGFGNLSKHVYFNTINYFRYCSGYIGVALFVFLLVSAFMRANLLGKAVVMMLLLTSFSSGIAISAFVVPYAAVIYSDFKERPGSEKDGSMRT